MEFLIVGFGNIGSRHAQALLHISGMTRIWVIEPNKETFEENLLKIGDSEGKVHRINSINELSISIDFCVIATSAGPRFSIMKNLVNQGIKKFLVEKVVFQSDAQFQEIIELLKINNAKAWCNFTNRYFPNYVAIKSRLFDNTKLTMTVIGGDFGLGCNALHYVDLFEYLTSSNASMTSWDFSENQIQHRRGTAYREIYGECVWETETGDRLLLISDKDRNSEIEIIIQQADTIDVLNQSTLKHITYSSDKRIEVEKFNLLYTSSLTNVIVEDIMKDEALLPTIEDTFNCHSQFFAGVNEALQISQGDLCPIT